MSTWNLLRFQDARDAYRLIGECRDLGAAPALWFPRLVEGLCSLVGVAAATGGEGVWDGARQRLQARSAFAIGLDESGLRSFSEWHRLVGPAACPIFHALRGIPAALVTRKRSELVTDGDWYRSASFLYRAGSTSDHQMTSLWRAPHAGSVNALCVHLEKGAADFTPRQQQLLDFLHAELGPLLGRALVSATEPSPAGLSPRLRQTLACLLEGDSEKQVAARLRLSPTTTHQYVTALYRHFGVRSRAQLMAHAIRRLSRAPWREIA